MNEDRIEWVVQYWDRGGWHNSGATPGVYTFTIAAALARDLGNFVRSLHSSCEEVRLYRIRNNRTLDSIPEAIL